MKEKVADGLTKCELNYKETSTFIYSIWAWSKHTDVAPEKG